MGISVEGLFTTALGLVPPWEVESVDLDQAAHRIEFRVRSNTHRFTCPACGVLDQPRHDGVARKWRHLDFFQFEAWIHCQVPRVACGGCGKTSQVDVPWAKPGSGFTLLFEALALSLARHMPVAQVAALLRTTDGKLWRRINTQVDLARAQESFEGVRHIGIDETSICKGHEYITVVHDLEHKRLLFATAGRSHQTVEAFADDLRAHRGRPQEIEHVCMDMSWAYAKGVGQALPQASISYDRFHVAQLAGKAMDEVRKAELREHPFTFGAAFAKDGKKNLKKLMWAMRSNEGSWSQQQSEVMQQLQDSTLESALAWRLKTGLRDVYERMRGQADKPMAELQLQAWCQWASESGLKPFKTLVATIEQHWAGVVAGMLDHRSNAYVEAMNGLLQQARAAARGYRTAKNFIAIAYLRMSKLTHLPPHPLRHATAGSVM
jgi:transposase